MTFGACRRAARGTCRCCGWGAWGCRRRRRGWWPAGGGQRRGQRAAAGQQQFVGERPARQIPARGRAAAIVQVLGFELIGQRDARQRRKRPKRVPEIEAAIINQQGRQGLLQSGQSIRGGADAADVGAQGSNGLRDIGGLGIDDQNLDRGAHPTFPRKDSARPPCIDARMINRSAAISQDPKGKRGPGRDQQDRAQAHALRSPGKSITARCRR